MLRDTRTSLWLPFAHARHGSIAPRRARTGYGSMTPLSPHVSPGFSTAGSIVAPESCLQRTRGIVKLDPAFVLYWHLGNKFTGIRSASALSVYCSHLLELTITTMYKLLEILRLSNYFASQCRFPCNRSIFDNAMVRIHIIVAAINKIYNVIGTKCIPYDDAWSPFYCLGLISIPAWISNYIHRKMWNEITYPFLKFNGAIVEVHEWISNFTPEFTGHVITCPCWD